MFDQLGRLILRARWLFVGFWLVAAGLFAAFSPSLSKVGSADETSFLPADAESLAARNIGRTAFPSDAAPAQALIVFYRDAGLTDADRAAIDGLRTWFAASGKSMDVRQYVTAEGSPQLASMFRSSDGTVELAQVNLGTASFLPATNAAVDLIRAHLAEAGVLPAGLQAQVTGQAGIGRDYLEAIQDGTDRTTIVTVFLVVLVLLLIYRAPLAALVPLITIAVAFLVARGILGFLAQGGWKLSSVLDSFIVVLAFGVGTDYTIFLLSRFREELGRHPHDEAVRVTVSRIGAVIAASAATVVVGLASMIVGRFGMIQTTGPALALVIVVTLLAGLTLTPSLLAISGRHLFWPRHEQTRHLTDDGRGFWAGLARLITGRPLALSVLVVALLAIPLAALPQLKQNFDVLQELPPSAESRLGFETLSDHLGSGQLMPLVVYVRADGKLSSSGELRALGDLESRIAAVPDVQTVRSVVDPSGSGGVADALKANAQLSAMAAQFSKAPSGDLAAQLGDPALSGLEAAQSYVSGLASEQTRVATSDSLPLAIADLKTLVDGLVATRHDADAGNQLDAIVAEIQQATIGSTGGSSADVRAQLAQLGAYVEELGAAMPEATAQPSYQSIQAALSALETGGATAVAGVQLLSGFTSLAAWFHALPAPFYFSPTSLPPSADATARTQAMAEARGRLPGELSSLAVGFAPTDLYAPPDLLAAFESADRSVARFYVTTATDPYDTRSFDTVFALRAMLADVSSTIGPSAHAYVGGATAEFADVQSTISSDFLRVAFITILGILIVLILLLRAVVAPLYLVLTVLLSYGGSLSLSGLILQRGFGEAGINYFIPLMVFVLLVALGSDYNIFLMSRVREESWTRPLREGIKVASARTGTVITSAGLILAGTFAALLSSPLMLLFQVGLAVALGVLIDTFVVRSLLVPAITAVVGDRAWWPFHRRVSK